MSEQRPIPYGDRRNKPGDVVRWWGVGFWRWGVMGLGGLGVVVFGVGIAAGVGATLGVLTGAGMLGRGAWDRVVGWVGKQNQKRVG